MTTWYEYIQRNAPIGGCVEECPNPGAIKMLHPTSQRISVNWKRKDTGELFRLGMKNPPPPNTRPPSG
jgi:hypothetical protein